MISLLIASVQSRGTQLSIQSRDALPQSSTELYSLGKWLLSQGLIPQIPLCSGAIVLANGIQPQ